MLPHRPDDSAKLEALADRLRRSPPPPVPVGLEARLLAGIPAAPRRRGRLARSWVAAAVLLTAAAAMLLAVRVPHPTPPPVPIDAPSGRQRADVVAV